MPVKGSGALIDGFPGGRWKCVECAVSRKWNGQVKRWAATGGWICAGCIAQEISDLKKNEADAIRKTELERRDATGDIEGDGDLIKELTALRAMWGSGWAAVSLHSSGAIQTSNVKAGGRYIAAVGIQEKPGADPFVPQVTIKPAHVRLVVCAPSPGYFTSACTSAESIAYLSCCHGAGCLEVMHSTTTAGLQEKVRSHEAAAKKKSTRAWAVERNYPVEKHAIR
jgi:hypothetical protein